MFWLVSNLFLFPLNNLSLNNLTMVTLEPNSPNSSNLVRKLWSSWLTILHFLTTPTYISKFLLEIKLVWTHLNLDSFLSIGLWAILVTWLEFNKSSNLELSLWDTLIIPFYVSFSMFTLVNLSLLLVESSYIKVKSIFLYRIL